MKKVIIGLCLFGLILKAQTASQPSPRCQAKIHDFSGAKPIAVLPAAERRQIVDVLLPDIRRFYRIVGGDSGNLQPMRLQELLQFEAVPGGQAREQLMIVRLVDNSCGAHGNCVAYVISLTPSGVRILVGRDPSFGQSAGGASEVGILDQVGSKYPQLLFMTHVSGFEVAIACFSWNDGLYIHVPCTPECAHFLDQPRPSDTSRGPDQRR